MPIVSIDCAFRSSRGLPDLHIKANGKGKRQKANATARAMPLPGKHAMHSFAFSMENIPAAQAIHAVPVEFGRASASGATFCFK